MARMLSIVECGLFKMTFSAKNGSFNKVPIIHHYLFKSFNHRPICEIDRGRSISLRPKDLNRYIVKTSLSPKEGIFLENGARERESYMLDMKRFTFIC